jgi:hypothetical protein
MSNLTGKELANELTNFVNNYNCNHDEFINAFCSEHRTLQQSSFRLFLMLMDKMASNEYGRNADARNEGTHKLAKKLMDGFKKSIIEDEIELGMSEEKAKNFADSEYAKPHRFLGHI